MRLASVDSTPLRSAAVHISPGNIAVVVGAGREEDPRAGAVAARHRVRERRDAAAVRRLDGPLGAQQQPQHGWRCRAAPRDVQQFDRLKQKNSSTPPPAAGGAPRAPRALARRMRGAPRRPRPRS